MRFDAIRVANGGRFSGCFDVMVWKSDRLAFVEYKGRGDSSNANERTWIDAAIRTGVHEQDLTFVLY